jgi:hypothetical protein
MESDYLQACQRDKQASATTCSDLRISLYLLLTTYSRTVFQGAKVLSAPAELFRVLRPVLASSPRLYDRMERRAHQHRVILWSQHSKGAKRYG